MQYEMENSHIPSESEKGKIILRGSLPIIQISQLDAQG